MQIIKIMNDSASLCLKHDEVLAINNALNEVCNGLTIPDFHARIGIEREQARELLRQVNEACARLGN